MTDEAKMEKLAELKFSLLLNLLMAVSRNRSPMSTIFVDKVIGVCWTGGQWGKHQPGFMGFSIA